MNHITLTGHIHAMNHDSVLKTHVTVTLAGVFDIFQTK